MSADEIRELASWNALVDAPPERVAAVQAIVLGEIAAQLVRLNEQIGEQTVMFAELRRAVGP